MVGVKGKRKMCEPELQPLPLPSPPLKSISTPHFQLHSPETSSRYSPRLVQRMQNDTCFRCHQQGHWARDCPLNSPNPKSRASITENSDFPKIYCRCGHGYCEVKTATNERNCGRKYYACPIKRGKKCRDFVKWCDDPVDEIDLRHPTFKYPTCSCGAGVCRKEKERNDPNEGRYYFACPIGEDHGACDFRLWEDTLLGNPVIDPAQRSGQRTLHDFWEGNQVHKTNINDLGKDGYSPSGLSKRMRITGDSQCSLVKTIFELPEGEDAVLKEAPMEGVDHNQTTESSTPTNHVNFPEFETVDDVEDIDFFNSVPWEAFEEKARSLCRLSTSSKIRSRQREFQRQISTAAVASLAEIENSVKEDLSPEEYLQCYEEEKVRLANICDDYFKTKALLEGSHQHCQSLRKEASRLKAMLHKVEDQLTSCELEMLKMETHLGEINASMGEAEKSEKVAAQASTARKLREEKKA